MNDTERKGKETTVASRAGFTDLPLNATRDIGAALRGLLADVFALYIKTKLSLAYVRTAFS
jgi:starvation-inducible DNA-binding protein